MQNELDRERRLLWEERCAFWSVQIRARFEKRCEEDPAFLGRASRALGLSSKVLKSNVNSGAAYRLPMDAVGHLMIMLGMPFPGGSFA